MDGALFSAIIAIAATGLLALFCLGAFLTRPRTYGDPDAVLFRHSVILRVIAVVLTLGMSVFLTIMIFLSPPKEHEVWIPFAAIGFFAALGLPLIWESMRFGLIAMHQGLDCRSPWKRGRFLHWEEVAEVSFGSAGSWFIIRAVDGWKFRIPTLVPRLARFLEICESYLPVTALEGARVGYDRLRRPFPGGPAPAPTFDLEDWIRRRKQRP